MVSQYGMLRVAGAGLLGLNRRDWLTASHGIPATEEADPESIGLELDL